MSAWIPAVSAIVGGFIGVLGTLLGSRLQFKEAARVRAEQYEREDKFRLHRDRIDAYSAFHLAAGNARKVMTSRNPEPQTLMDARTEVWAQFTRVLLVGDQRVLKAVAEILDYVTDVAHNSGTFDAAEYRELIFRYQKAARSDLVGADE